MEYRTFDHSSTVTVVCKRASKYDNYTAGVVLLNEDFTGLPSGAVIQSVVMSCAVSASINGTRQINDKTIGAGSVTVVLQPKQTQQIKLYYKANRYDSDNNLQRSMWLTNISYRVGYEIGGEEPGTREQDSGVYLPTIVQMSNGQTETGSLMRYLEPVKKLHPQKLALTLNVEPTSTASITIPAEDLPVEIGALVMIPHPQGQSLMFVRSISTDYINKAQTILDCVDVYELLAQTMIIGKASYQAVSGSTAYPTAVQAIEYALNKQNFTASTDLTTLPLQKVLISLGDVDTSFRTLKNDWSYSDADVKSAIQDVFDCLDEYQLSFEWTNMNNGSWTMHIKKQPTTATAELRMSRNIVSLRAKLDFTDMYNVAYPRGRKNLTISTAAAKTWTKRGWSIAHGTGSAGVRCLESERRWGRRVVVIDDSNKTNASALMEWSASELAKHCEPLINVSCDALELSKASGVELDRLAVGKRVRIPLPQYGVTLEDRIVTAQWADLMADPYSITLTIGHERRTVESVTNKQKVKTKKQQKTQDDLIAELMSQTTP